MEKRNISEKIDKCIHEIRDGENPEEAYVKGRCMANVSCILGEISETDRDILYALLLNAKRMRAVVDRVSLT